MAEALKLAHHGSLTCKPNPAVGALITTNNQVIARGFHKVYGGPHAEVEAVNNIPKDINSNKCTLYVTLEPCAHQGKTPPCVDLIIKSGIKRVVIAALDPNPSVNGKGIKILKDAGIDVSSGILETQAIKMNHGFHFRMKTQRPFIRSKIASSVDGKIGLSNYQSKWITNDHSRKNVQNIRQQSNGILTSYKTINFDNPRLTVRHLNEDEQPIRFILDANLKIKEDAQILNQKNVVVYHAGNYKKHSNHCAEFVKISKNKNKLNLFDVMKHMNSLEINNLLIEAGSGINGEFFSNKLIDQLIIFQGNTILAGGAKQMFDEPILSDMKERVCLDRIDQRHFGNDLRSIFNIRYVD